MEDVHNIHSDLLMEALGGNWEELPIMTLTQLDSEPDPVVDPTDLGSTLTDEVMTTLAESINQSLVTTTTTLLTNPNLNLTADTRSYSPAPSEASKRRDITLAGGTLILPDDNDLANVLHLEENHSFNYTNLDMLYTDMNTLLDDFESASGILASTDSAKMEVDKVANTDSSR